MSPTPKTMKSTFGSVTWPATTPAATDKLRLKKGPVDPSPARRALDSITSALVPFWPLPSPRLASHMAMGSIPNFHPSSSAAASIVTGPSSFMEAQGPFSVGGKLFVTTSTSNVSILDTTFDSAATESDGGASGADLGAPIVDGFDVAIASMLDALVGAIADGKCDQ